MSEKRSIAARARRLLWYEPGEGFAERGVWKYRPAAYVREHMFLAAFFLIMQIGFYVWVFLLDGLLVNGSFPYDVFLSWVPLLVCIPRIRRLRREMKKVVPARGLVCPRCLYDLRNLGAVSVCPECGQAVDVELLPRQWARSVRDLRYGDVDREPVSGWREV